MARLPTETGAVTEYTMAEVKRPFHPPGSSALPATGTVGKLMPQSTVCSPVHPSPLNYGGHKYKVFMKTPENLSKPSAPYTHRRFDGQPRLLSGRKTMTQDQPLTPKIMKFS